jgi:hypothetical protein
MNELILTKSCQYLNKNFTILALQAYIQLLIKMLFLFHFLKNETKHKAIFKVKNWLLPAKKRPPNALNRFYTPFAKVPYFALNGFIVFQLVPFCSKRNKFFGARWLKAYYATG